MRRLFFVLALFAAAPVAAQSPPPRDTATARDSTADSVTAGPAAAPGAAPGAADGSGGSVTPCIHRAPDGSCDKRWRPENGGSAGLDGPCVDKDMNAACDDEPELGRRRGFFSWLGGLVTGLWAGNEEEKEKDRSGGGGGKKPARAPEATPRQRPPFRRA